MNNTPDATDKVFTVPATADRLYRLNDDGSIDLQRKDGRWVLIMTPVRGGRALDVAEAADHVGFAIEAARAGARRQS